LPAPRKERLLEARRKNDLASLGRKKIRRGVCWGHCNESTQKRSEKTNSKNVALIESTAKEKNKELENNEKRKPQSKTEKMKGGENF